MKNLIGFAQVAAGYIIGAAIVFALMAGLFWILAITDSVGMARGVIFGVVAGLPVAVLVLAGRRRNE